MVGGMNWSSLFAYGYPNVAFVEKFPPLPRLCTFVRNQLWVCVQVCFQSLDLSVRPYTTVTLSGPLSPARSPGTGWCWPPTRASWSNLFWRSRSFSVFMWILESASQSTEESLLGLDGIPLTLYIILYNSGPTGFLPKLSLPCHEQTVSLRLLRSSLNSQQLLVGFSGQILGTFCQICP